MFGKRSKVFTLCPKFLKDPATTWILIIYPLVCPKFHPVYFKSEISKISVGRNIISKLGLSKEIWLSPMTKAPTPIEKSKKQSDNTKNATKNFDYTTIKDQLRTVRLILFASHHIVSLVFEILDLINWPLTNLSHLVDDYFILKMVATCNFCWLMATFV